MFKGIVDSLFPARYRALENVAETSLQRHPQLIGMLHRRLEHYTWQNQFSEIITTNLEMSSLVIRGFLNSNPDRKVSVTQAS